MERKKMAIPALLVAAIIMGAVSLPQSQLESSLHPEGRLVIQIDRLDGTKEVQYIHNTATNILKNQTRDTRMGVASGNTTILALLLSTGTTGPAATDTACEATVVTGNGLDPVNGTVALATGIGNYSITYKWTATGAQAGIAKVCLSNDTAATSSLMASALLSSAVTLANGENLTVTYYVAET